MNRTFSIRLDDETSRVLEEEVRRTNQSKGKVIREALLERRQSKIRTALDGLRKYAGIMEGPADLSTNKEHLAGFGRALRR